MGKSESLTSNTEESSFCPRPICAKDVEAVGGWTFGELEADTTVGSCAICECSGYIELERLRLP
jgi:hypothetical protein